MLSLGRIHSILNSVTISYSHFQANKSAPTKLLNHTNVVGDDSQDTAGGTESWKDQVGTQHLQSRGIASSLSACQWTFMAAEVEVKTVALEDQDFVYHVHDHFNRLHYMLK